MIDRGAFELEIRGKVVSQWLRLDQALGAAFTLATEAFARGEMAPSFKVFETVAAMRLGKRVRRLRFAGGDVSESGPAALERPGPDQHRNPS